MKMHPTQTEAMARAFTSLKAWLRASRTAIYSAALLLAASLCLYEGVQWWHADGQNARLKQIMEGKDIAVDVSKDDERLLVARVRALEAQDRFDEAQTLFDTILPGLTPDAKATLYYNHANTLITRALGRIERSDLDGAIPLVNLAKDNYRRALRLQPGNFDIKHNYDVALRLVRDFPPGGPDGEDETATPKKLWTDLPGLPKGLP